MSHRSSLLNKKASYILLSRAVKIIVAGSSPLPNKLSQALRVQHEVDESDLGRQFLFQLAKQQHPLVLLWAKNLPFFRLKKILQFIQKRFPKVTVLIACANYDSPQRAMILMDGAKDCVSGRACADELLARISIIAQDFNDSNGFNSADGFSGFATNKPFLKRHFTFDFSQNSASYRGAFIPLNRKESLILRCLLRRPNTIIPRKILYNSAWDSPLLPASNSLDVHVSSIRRKIEKPYGIKLIEAVKGQGYRARSDW